MLKLILRLMRSTVFIAIMRWLAPKIWQRLSKQSKPTTAKRKYVRNKAK